MNKIYEKIKNFVEKKYNENELKRERIENKFLSSIYDLILKSEENENGFVSNNQLATLTLNTYQELMWLGNKHSNLLSKGRSLKNILNKHQEELTE